MQNAAPASKSLLDQELAERVARLRVRAAHAVDGIRSGIHKSPHRGASVIFAEHRDYRPGDDLRMLDWRAFARNDRYTVKHFEQETHLRANLLLDLSASMAYDGGHPERQKATHAATLLSAFAWILLGQGDAVGAFAFDVDLRKSLPARNRPDHLDALLSVLALPVARDVPASRTGLAATISGLGERVGRRGLVVLASDLIDPDPEALAPLSRLSALGHEIIVLQVLHPHEIDFPFKHGLRFEDPESPDHLEADADSVRAAYKRELEAFLTTCRQRCVSSGARYALARTDKPVEETIASVLLQTKRAAWG